MERRAKLGVLGNELLGMYMHRGHVQTEERETRRRNGCAAEELKKSLDFDSSELGHGADFCFIAVNVCDDDSLRMDFVRLLFTFPTRRNKIHFYPGPTDS
jgi:hypothetical protein